MTVRANSYRRRRRFTAAIKEVGRDAGAGREGWTARRGKPGPVRCSTHRQPEPLRCGVPGRQQMGRSGRETLVLLLELISWKHPSHFL